MACIPSCTRASKKMAFEPGVVPSPSSEESSKKQRVDTSAVCLTVQKESLTSPLPRPTVASFSGAGAGAGTGRQGFSPSSLFVDTCIHRSGLFPRFPEKAAWFPVAEGQARLLRKASRGIRSDLVWNCFLEAWTDVRQASIKRLFKEVDHSPQGCLLLLSSMEKKALGTEPLTRAEQKSFEQAKDFFNTEMTKQHPVATSYLERTEQRRGLLGDTALMLAFEARLALLPR